MTRRRLLLSALLFAGVPAAAWPDAEGPFLLAEPQRSGRDARVFPGARCDPRETAALASPSTPGAPDRAVYRVARPFGVVVNYYRFTAKQAVQVSREDLGARFLRIGRALAGAHPPRALLEDPLVVRFTRRTVGSAGPASTTAVRSWRTYAGRFSGVVQQVGEGDRVTIYQPYLSQHSFALIEDTVIIIHRSGGSCDVTLATDQWPDARLRRRPGGRHPGADRKRSGASLYP
ncbi:MAG TPA: hypothetical protein VK886_15435 [Vicinamibacterales bacterium]|nr:hypothetical protein [Vicinamibacterales bacterium]